MPQCDADDCMCCRRIGVSQLGNEEGGKHAFAMHLLRRVPVSAEQESACCWLLCRCLISPPHQDSEPWRSSTTVALAAGSSASRALRNQFAGSLAFAMHYDLNAMSTTRTPTPMRIPSHYQNSIVYGGAEMALSSPLVLPCIPPNSGNAAAEEGCSRCSESPPWGNTRICRIAAGGQYFYKKNVHITCAHSIGFRPARILLFNHTWCHAVPCSWVLQPKIISPNAP